MSVTDPVYQILLEKGPLISGDIQKDLVYDVGLSRNASRKRIERSRKTKLIKRYFRISNKGYVYYIPDYHNLHLVIKRVIKYIEQYNSRLFFIMKILNDNNIITINEICRLLHLNSKIEYYYEKNTNKIHIKKNPSVIKIINKLKMLGYKQNDKYIIINDLNHDYKNLINIYIEKMINESLILSLSIHYLIETGVNVKLTNYRVGRYKSILLSKFDSLGKAGRKKIVGMVIECQTRRSVTTYDLMGFKNRRGSTISINKLTKPIISYFVSNKFSDECINYAKKESIRLLLYDGTRFSEIKPGYVNTIKSQARGGRFSNLRGQVFEAWVSHAYKKHGYEVHINKMFYINKHNNIVESPPGNEYTDVDVYVVNENHEVYLIQCKSSKNQLESTKIITTVNKYNKIAQYIENKYGYNKIHILLICNYNDLDARDASKLTSYLLDFITPSIFWDQNRGFLKGAPKWLFKEIDV